jgi:hypothetical protein
MKPAQVVTYFLRRERTPKQSVHLHHHETSHDRTTNFGVVICRLQMAWGLIKKGEETGKKLADLFGLHVTLPG